MRVLITRAGRDAAHFRAQLEVLGMTVVELPTIAIAPPDDPAPVDDALHRLSNYHWIIFTSRNAVQAVAERLQLQQKRSVPWPSVAAVGPATAAALREHGLPFDCAPDEARASALVDVLRDQMRGARVLLPQGDRARSELAEGLRAAGADVDVVIAYRTVQAPLDRRAAIDALRRGEIDVIALASPSAFEHLTAMLGADLAPLQYTRLACIGPTTAEAVRNLGLEPAVIAQEHTLTGLVAAIGGLKSEVER